MKLELKNVSYSYKKGNELFSEINQLFLPGKMYAIIGKSGIGKTTLLLLLGGMLKPTSGEVYFDEKSIEKIGMTKYRNLYVGYVYQQYNLLEYYSVYQNVRESLEICRKRIERSEKKIVQILKDLDIKEELWEKNVRRLSGGEQQRVAIARALVKEPDILLADEPTGNLDDDTADQIQKVLHDVAQKYQKCVILVTHSKAISERADIVLELSGKGLNKI